MSQKKKLLFIASDEIVKEIIENPLLTKKTLIPLSSGAKKLYRTKRKTRHKHYEDGIPVQNREVVIDWEGEEVPRKRAIEDAGTMSCSSRYCNSLRRFGARKFVERSCL